MSVQAGRSAQLPGPHHGSTTVLTYEAVWHEKRARDHSNPSRAAYRLAPRTPPVNRNRDAHTTKPFYVPDEEEAGANNNKPRAFPTSVTLANHC